MGVRFLKSIFLIAILFTFLGLMVFFKDPGTLKPTIIIRPSTFDSPEQLGVVMFKRFWSEVNTAPIVILASSPFWPEPHRVWAGFLAAAHERGIRFSQFIQIAGLASLDDFTTARGTKKITTTSVPSMLEKLKEYTTGSVDKTLLHVSADDATWIGLQNLPGKNLFLFQTILPTTPARAELLNQTCNQTKLEFQLSCQALRALSPRKLKKVDPNKNTVYVEKHFDRLHLIYGSF